MKRSKFLILVAILAITALTVSLFIVPAFAADSKVTDADFIASPSYGQLTKGEDYAYSFAVVGDTQTLNINDVKAGTSNLKNLYQWILDNKDSKNIQYVLGLGDITDKVYKTNPDELYDANYGEWQNALDALNMLNGKIPYSLVRGNHDGFDEFNATFGAGSYYYNNLVEMAANENAGFYTAYVDSSNTVFKIGRE